VPAWALSDRRVFYEAPAKDKKKIIPEPRYGPYLREGQESGLEETNDGFWRRAVARTVHKGQFEPYYYRWDRPVKAKAKRAPKVKFLSPEYETDKTKKKRVCTDEWGYKIKCPKIRTIRDLSVVAQYEPDNRPIVEYRDPPVDYRVIRDSRGRVLLRARTVKGRLIGAPTPAPAATRFVQVFDEDEDEDEDEADDEGEEAEAEQDAEQDAEDEEEAAEGEADEAADAETVPRFMVINTATETEAEAVANLRAAKWGERAVEADVRSPYDIARTRTLHRLHIDRERKMKPVCYRGDAKCLAAAQEADAKREAKRMAKFKHKPRIFDPKKEALKRKPMPPPKRPEFLAPVYQQTGFVAPIYRPDKKLPPTGLPPGWMVPSVRKKMST